jgi:hypothetical protein
MPAARFVRSPWSARTPFGQADTDERSLKSGPRLREVGLLDGTFEGSLGFAPGTFGPLQVDLRVHIGGLGEDDDAIRADLHETAEDGELLLLVAGLET